jgi:hypothetical protein
LLLSVHPVSSRTSRAEDLYEFLVQLIVAIERDETRKLEMWLSVCTWCSAALQVLGNVEEEEGGEEMDHEMR